MATSKKASKQAAAVVAPVAPVAQAAPVVALRGGLAISAVAFTSKPYRTKAAHNAGWWAIVTANNAGSVDALIKAGVPSRFIGYTVRRGYLASVAA